MTTVARAPGAPAPHAYGEVFTRRWVVELMLDMVGYTPDRDLTRLVVVEPSVGSGAFVGPLVRRLVQARPPATAWERLGPCLHGFDIQADHVAAARAAAEAELLLGGCPRGTARVLARGWIQEADFLLVGKDIAADLVIGNPPYIRIEDLPAPLLRRYRQVAPTMTGRADIFVGFFEHGLDLLRPGGKLAFICADRWMRNSYGRALRGKVIRGGFSVDDVLVMHDAPAFETEVSAYPAITVVRRGEPRTTVAATATASFDDSRVADFLAWRRGRSSTLTTDAVAAARISRWHVTDDVWPDGPPDVTRWLAELAERFPPIEDQARRTRIGIGIATGADKVYLPQGIPDVEPQQLVPMVFGADIRSGTFVWGGRYLVSPWGPDGLVDLRERPRLRAYLSSHRPALEARNVARRTPHWFRTIDRLNPDLLTKDLLVMEDMKARTHPVRVPAGHYPHHNLTWIASDEWDLDVLGGLLLSRVTEVQVGAHCVRMRGGTLRFQPTVMRKVRLPGPASIAAGTRERLARAFRSRDRAAADSAALEALDMPVASLPAVCCAEAC